MGVQRSGSASALHAEGPGFNPRRLQYFIILKIKLTQYATQSIVELALKHTSHSTVYLIHVMKTIF